MCKCIVDLAKIAEFYNVMKLPHVKVLEDFTVEIYAGNNVFTRNFKDLQADYVKILNQESAMFPTEHEGQPNKTVNLLVGLDDMENAPFDNHTDVIVQVTLNSWGFDCDIMLMGGYRKKVFFRGDLLLDSGVSRITWVPLFERYEDLKGSTNPIL